MTIQALISGIRNGSINESNGDSAVVMTGGDRFVLAALLANIGPSFNAIAVTPNDATILPPHRQIIVGGAGDITVQQLDDSTALIANVAAGTQLPLCVKRIMATGTSATNFTILV